MANYRSVWLIPVLFFSLFGLISCIYEDQVGKFDWMKTFVGKVKQAHFENRRIIVATEENVLACLNAKNGDILWRQLLEDPKDNQIQLLYVNKDVFTVSGSASTLYIRSWNLPSGTLNYEWIIRMEKEADSEFSIIDDQLIQAVPNTKSHLDVAVYNLQTGEKLKELRIATPWLVEATKYVNYQIYPVPISKCYLTKSVYACVSAKQIDYVDVLTQKTKSQELENFISEPLEDFYLIPYEDDKPAILLVGNDRSQIVFLSETAEVFKQNLVPIAISIKDEDTYVFQLEPSQEIIDNKFIKATSRNIKTGQIRDQILIDYPLGLGAPYIAAGACKAGNCELLLCSADNAISLLRLPEGKTIWTREEALGGIVASQFLELPVSELDASIENEFKSSTDDIFSMLSHRLTTQARQLLNFGNQLTNHALVRDDFGLHNIIVVASKIGKLFGIDTLSGSIVWTSRVLNIKPFQKTNKMILFVQRTARYPPLDALCMLLAEDAETGLGVIFQFDPITGKSINGVQRLNVKIQQAVLLPYENEADHMKGVLILTENNEVILYPNHIKSFIKSSSSTTYVYTVDDRSVLRGFNIDKKNEKLRANAMWEVRLGPGKIVGLGVKPPNERVHSQGRVLPDRSVYYKYVNPNLIAVSTISDDPVHKHVLSIYLVDGVNGLVVYSTSHRRAKDPVHLVHSENWLVYSYFSERFRRTEIVALELYEGNIQSNSTVFTSHAVSLLPLVQTQSYIFPANPVSMAVTLTERGITNKFLLMGTSTGAVYQVPWLLLQPRFDNVPCGPEESCIPYMPEMPLSNEAIVNYNQSIGRIRGIEVAPARLESTSHILIHGLDLFYTRVAPSKTFDLLKEDFDHKLIVFVLVGLVVASYISKHFASRKILKQAWK